MIHDLQEYDTVSIELRVSFRKTIKFIFDEIKCKFFFVANKQSW